MSEIARRPRLEELAPQERADKAYDCFEAYGEGKNYTQISRETGLTVNAVKKLIAEHARTVENYRPETRSVAENQYRRLLAYFWSIMNDAANHPVLVQAKAMEGAISVLTRLDKFYGHEAPQVNLHGDVETAYDLLRRANEGGWVSPVEMAAIEIDEAEVPDDGTD